VGGSTHLPAGGTRTTPSVARLRNPHHPASRGGESRHPIHKLELLGRCLSARPDLSHVHARRHGLNRAIPLAKPHRCGRATPWIAAFSPTMPCAPRLSRNPRGRGAFASRPAWHYSTQCECLARAASGRGPRASPGERTTRPSPAAHSAAVARGSAPPPSVCARHPTQTSTRLRDVPSAQAAALIAHTPV
jgi:hypothetical protein